MHYDFLSLLERRPETTIQICINKFANSLAYKYLHNNFDEEASFNLPSITRQARFPTNAMKMDGITQMSSISGNPDIPAFHIDNGVEHSMGNLETAKRPYCRIC